MEERVKIKSIRKRPKVRGPCSTKGCKNKELYAGRGKCFSCQAPVVG